MSQVAVTATVKTCTWKISPLNLPYINYTLDKQNSEMSKVNDTAVVERGHT